MRRGMWICRDAEMIVRRVMEVVCINKTGTAVVHPRGDQGESVKERT